MLRETSLFAEKLPTPSKSEAAVPSQTPSSNVATGESTRPALTAPCREVFVPPGAPLSPGSLIHCPCRQLGPARTRPSPPPIPLIRTVVVASLPVPPRLAGLRSGLEPVRDPLLPFFRCCWGGGAGEGGAYQRVCCNIDGGAFGQQGCVPSRGACCANCLSSLSVLSPSLKDGRSSDGACCVDAMFWFETAPFCSVLTCSFSLCLSRVKDTFGLD